MKRIYTLIAGGVLAGAVLTSCDSVSEPDRIVPAEIIPQRALLIEEFTGQRCTNCPDGHAVIKDMLVSLGDSVVPVSIHPTSIYAEPSIMGLKTATGEEYYKAAGSPALPTAVINKQTNPLQVQEWGSAVNHLILDSTPFTVKAENTLSADGDKMNIKVAYSSGEDFTGKLQVWVLENHVIGMQIDHGTRIDAYDHMHVFRQAVNGTWGEDVTLKAHEAQNAEYTVDINPFWTPENVYVVAFLYDNGGVRQVTSTATGH